jgi:hypothetical protein
MKPRNEPIFWARGSRVAADMARRLCVFAGAAFLCCLASTSVAQAPPGYGEEQPSANRPLSVSGAVFDDAGRPLNGVRVLVLEFRSVPTQSIGKISHRSRSYTAHDGMFEASCEACLSLDLEFHRPGCMPQTLEVMRDEVVLGRGSATEQRFLMDADGARRNLFVTLTRMTEPVELDSYSVRPAAAVADAGKVGILDFDRRKGDSVSAEEVPREVSKRVADGEVATVHLRLAPEADGVAVAKVLRASGEIAESPSPVVLRLEGGEGGFVPYTPRASTLHTVYREMTQAPESGYADLTLSRDSGVVFFYCKVGDRYGKGRVTPIMLSRRGGDDPQVEVGVEIRLNLGGTRSVESAK